MLSRTADSVIPASLRGPCPADIGVTVYIRAIGVTVYIRAMHCVNCKWQSAVYPRGSNRT